MPDRPSTGGAETAVAPAPGYYPDPSVPGFVRYWGGTAWVPGTSRPAPASGEVPQPPSFVARYTGGPRGQSPAPRQVPPPVVTAPPDGPVNETGPLFFDETTGGASFSMAPRPELVPHQHAEVAEVAARPVEQLAGPAGPGRASVGKESGWRADPLAQNGLLETGSAPRRVSWGTEAPAETDLAVRAVRAAPEPASALRPPVDRPARVAAPAPAPAYAPAAVPTAVPAPAAAPPRPRRAAVPRPPAGLGRRLVARLLDTAVLAVIGLAAGVPLISSAVEHVQGKLAEAEQMSELTHQQVNVWLIDPLVLGKCGVLLGLLVMAGFLYEVVPTARTGQTFGKRLAGIRVVDARGSVRNTAPPSTARSTTRWLVGHLAVLTLVGLLSPARDRTARRGWPDRAGATRVVRA